MTPSSNRPFDMRASCTEAVTGMCRTGSARARIYRGAQSRDS
jgi:hypothetical protein